MIPPMTDTDQNLIILAERLVQAGDYRLARQTALQVANGELGPEDSARLARILKVTGIDPFAVGVLLFSLGVLTFLIVKYAL